MKTENSIQSRFFQPFQRLHWKLISSYTAVTVGALLVIVLVLGYLLFSKVLVPKNILNNVLTPEAWIQAVSENTPPEWPYVLSQNPVDTKLVCMLLQNGDLQITHFELFKIGDLQIQLKTTGLGSVLIISPDWLLLGASNSILVKENEIGKPLNRQILPNLEAAFRSALSGNLNPEQLFFTLEEDEQFYFVVPYLDDKKQQVLALGIFYFESLPTENDIPSNLLNLISQSILILLLAAGLVGTIFGAFTARGMVRRLQRVSEVSEAWSQGDFSEFIQDSKRDEISELADRLNEMAEQLKNYVHRSQEMAISEERNRLARDLHDSSKQEALAASFQLGTALTLLEQDPITAKKHLLEADHLIDSVRQELTDLIHELRPPNMMDANFEEIIRDYLIEWAHQTGIRIEFKSEGIGEISLERKQAIYRIMQESVANVARHSGAKKVQVFLSYDNEHVVFELEDDGSGFVLNQSFKGIGLDSMRERAEFHQGVLEIVSDIDRGTKISVVFPTE
ncbi:MAG: HAMP domain-containing protein [Anaerolineaceae bacterium]|nr:HAMP domain-containing protein [Anaerolineaceae bacterium]